MAVRPRLWRRHPVPRLIDTGLTRPPASAPDTAGDWPDEGGMRGGRARPHWVQTVVWSLQPSCVVLLRPRVTPQPPSRHPIDVSYVLCVAKCEKSNQPLQLLGTPWAPAGLRYRLEGPDRGHQKQRRQGSATAIGRARCPLPKYIKTAAICEY